MGFKGSIPVSQGLGVNASTIEPTLNIAEANFGGFQTKSQFAFRFNCTHSNRIYHLAADTLKVISLQLLFFLL